MLYSAQTGGFYDRKIHGDNIPSDAVEITAEEHRALLEGQSKGKLIAANLNGFPILSDQPPLTSQQLLFIRKQEAKTYLDSTDWYYARLAETNKEVPAEVVEKRAEARVVLQE